MKSLFENLPALIAIVSILIVIAVSIWDSGRVDLEENKIESPEKHIL